MANKTPIRAVFNDAGTATGLSEFQTGDTVGLTHGGLGASLSIGSAGQVLKVNSGASALEFGSVEAIINIDGMTDGSSATIADTDKFAISDGGTEKFVTASQISTYVNAELGLDIDSYADGTGITLAATDKFVVSDGGTEKRLNASQIDTFVSGTSSTLTNKTLTAPTINGVVVGTATSQTITTLTTSTIANGGSNAITLSGANVTIAGNLSVSGQTTTVDSTTVSIQNAFVFEGATADAHETTLTTIDPTADRTISLPNATGTIVLKDTTDTLTNKSIDSDNNTITNIVNADIKSSAAIAFSKMENLTTARALVSDGNGDVSVSAVTSTEIGHLDGVTSAIQTQLDTKTTQAFAMALAMAL